MLYVTVEGKCVILEMNEARITIDSHSPNHAEILAKKFREVVQNWATNEVDTNPCQTRSLVP